MGLGLLHMQRSRGLWPMAGKAKRGILPVMVLVDEALLFSERQHGMHLEKCIFAQQG